MSNPRELTGFSRYNTTTITLLYVLGSKKRMLTYITCFLNFTRINILIWLYRGTKRFFVHLLYFIIFYYILLYFIIFYYILLYFIIFYYILLYFIIFYYI
jgi:hypothetical protein